MLHRPLTSSLLIVTALILCFGIFACSSDDDYYAPRSSAPTIHGYFTNKCESGQHRYHHGHEFQYNHDGQYGQVQRRGSDRGELHQYSNCRHDTPWRHVWNPHGYGWRENGEFQYELHRNRKYTGNGWFHTGYSLSAGYKRLYRHHARGLRHFRND